MSFKWLESCPKVLANVVLGSCGVRCGQASPGGGRMAFLECRRTSGPLLMDWLPGQGGRGD